MKWPRLTAAAYRDLAGATAFYACRGREIGLGFVEDFEQALEQIQRSPRQFSRLETDDSLREIRRVVLQRYTYLIIYEIRNETPEVLAVVHASQEPNAWKSPIED